MPTRIDAEIGLNASTFRRGLQAAGKGVTDFVNKGEREFGRLGLSIGDLTQSNRELRALIAKSYDIGSISRYNRALQENEAELRRIAQATGHATNELNDFGRKGANSFGAANNAALSFSQIIQDAPYGIRGVANNITQLTTNLGFMAAEAKAAGTSMRTAFIASITNPATLAILAVSAVTTGLQLFADSSREAAKEAESLAGALDKAAASVAGEVSQFKALVSIAQDAGQGRKAQQAAINQLNKEYDIFNGTLNINNVNSEKNIELIDKQTESLIRQAKIKGVLDKITELSNKQIELENSGIKENINAWDFLTSSILSGGNAIAANTRLSTIALKNRGEALNENAQAIENFNIALRELLAIDKNESGGGGASGKIVSAVREQVTALNSELQGIGQLTGIATNIQTSIVSGVQGSIGIVRDQGVGLARAFNEGFAEILEYGLEEAIGNLAASLGEAFANGSSIIQATGASLLSSMGGILVNLGKMAIAAGIGIKSVRKALLTLSGPVAIAAGVALVAIGSAFASGAKNLASNMGSSGGGASSGSAGSNTTTITPAAGGIQGTVVFEIAGRSLVGILKREAAYGNRVTP